MVTKISDLPTIAGVVCPKKTGEMNKSEPCSRCQHWMTCMAKIMGYLEAEG